MHDSKMVVKNLACPDLNKKNNNNKLFELYELAGKNKVHQKSASYRS
jgi:hypothetical protein